VKFHKRLLRSTAVRGVLCALAAQYIRLVHATSRWRVERGEIPEAYWQAGKPFILAFWHGRLLMMPYCWPRDMRINLLTSQHVDGQLIAGMARHFGLASVTGSTSRGGSGAVRSTLRALKRGEYVGMTPDGPRGPRMRAASGIIDIARMSGAPIVPAACATSRRRVLGTWDRFIAPLPFSQGVFVWGTPLKVPRDADSAACEAARRTLENEINAVTRGADRLVGQRAIEPALPAAAGNGASASNMP
jgi:hypothetical protein